MTGDPDERVRHRALGARPPDPALADDLHVAAAGLAARGAPAEAADLFEHAARLTPNAEPDARARRLIAAAGHHDEAGDSDRAAQLFQELVDALPRGHTRSAALLGLSTFAGSHDRARAVLAQAADDVGDDHDLATQIALRTHETHTLQRALVDADVASLHRAMERAEAHGDPVGWSELAATVLFSAMETGHGLDQVLVDRIERTYDPWAPPRFHTAADESVGATVALTLFWTGQVERAAWWLSRERRALETAGRLTALGYAAIRSVVVELSGGDYPAAAAFATLAQELARPAGSEPAAAHFVVALVAAHRGQVALARREATRGSLIAQQAGDNARWCTNESVLAFVDLSLADAEAASRRLAVLLPTARELFFEPSAPPIWSDAVEALIARGELEQAEALLEPLEERGRLLDRTWVHATTARLRGMLLAARGSTAAAEEAFQAALTHHEALVDPLGHGRTHLALGATLRRARRKADARDALQHAHDIFHRLGAELWRSRAEDELSHLGLRPPAGTDAGGLTAAERRVAELVATGLSNRQVAGRLFLSAKTVEAHLSHVYAKLGVRSRTELAHLLATRT